MPESTFFQFLPKKNYLNKKVATFENFVKDVVFVYFEIEKVEIFVRRYFLNTICIFHHHP